MFSPRYSQQPVLLTSWKQIAAYLGKGVRTAQRWELQFGLPVRRPNERNQGIVCASVEDLDRWLNEQWSAQRGNGAMEEVKSSRNHVAAVQASLNEARMLRDLNRKLAHELHLSLCTVLAECQRSASICIPLKSEVA